MRSKKKKLTIKQSRRIKVLLLSTGLLICCYISLTLLIGLNLSKNNFYKIEKRINDIAKEKKKDEEGIETVAWLRVQGTSIDTPIINYEEGKDISYLEKEDFLWNETSGEEHYNQVKIMGHNILNLSATPEIGVEYFTKFEDLMAFTYEDFVKDNKYIQYTVDGKNYIYKIFGVLYEKGYNLDLYHKGNYTLDEMRDYLKLVKEKSIYEFDVDVNEEDEIICLVTCTRMYGVDQKRQFVVVGRLLRNGEKIENYSVKITDAYKEVQKVMKGETSNEEV